MIRLYDTGIYLVNGTEICQDAAEASQKTGRPVERDAAARGTIAYDILKAHNTVDDMDNLRLKFDSMTSHDITYVGIIQTARASGMKAFPLPYALTNCHNSLCPAPTSTAASTCPPTWRTSTPTTGRPWRAAAA